MSQGSYSQLEVWKKAMSLVTEIYKITGIFPSEERYSLTSQMRRAAVSIPSNIAEGRMRISRKEFKRFVSMAFGSGAELETQMQIARNLSYLDQTRDEADNLLEEVIRMLNALLQKL